VILALEYLFGGYIEEHGSAVSDIGSLVMWCPLSAGETSDTLAILFNFEETHSWSFAIAGSMKISIHPAISGTSVT
jgi:hypothetical protein